MKHRKQQEKGRIKNPKKKIKNNLLTYLICYRISKCVIIFLRLVTGYTDDDDNSEDEYCAFTNNRTF